MKKYLFIGLAILIGTNLVVLSGVAYNRMGEATAQLTLTERELTLRSNSDGQKENSGTSLYINWRTPTAADDVTYYSYNSRNIELSKDQLMALGFEIEVVNDYWVESRELYWVLEFDGGLHKTEIEKVAVKCQSVAMTYEKQPNDNNGRDKKECHNRLQREKISNSRLFFVEAAADYSLLANKYSGQQNILIVKGLAKPNYNPNDETYNLLLDRLSVSNIMVPLAHTANLSGLERPQGRNIQAPRYAVDVKWGSRLEPWVVAVEKRVK